MAGNPTRLHISERFKKVIADSVKQDEYLRKLDNKHIFFLSLLLGYSKRTKLELSSKEGYVRAEYLNEQEDSLLKALAVADSEDIRVITDMNRVYAIAEQYANGGVDHFKALVLDDPGSFLRKLSALIQSGSTKSG